ncbi:hypothetical protein DM01DRAFT_1302780 [Hesseltinella vesiculosa]|uniref:Uncharacterized protein n=1 Tax=Hesseltinella vesiculosa TaxID=101127 RepID=A0A1X2GN54_9FUNG|nr:hypothetical protein DM01DRAFT_1302780 [Hesseltinella vesiculosa]
MDVFWDPLAQWLGAGSLPAFFQHHADQTLEFMLAVDWYQPWLLVLLACHCICLMITLLLRNQSTALSWYFFLLLGLAALTQPLNQLGHQHWQQFATANYFDPSGLFIVSVYAFPLIFNGFVVLMIILKTTFGLMVETKRRQLTRKKNE